MKRAALILLALLVASVLVALALRPRITQDYEFPTGYLEGLETFDTSDWAEVLRNHVDDLGRVDYEALRAQRTPLTRFLALIGKAGPSTRPELFPTREDRLAYWVNAYNAIVMDQVLRHWPLDSVIDHRLSIFVVTRYDVDGRALSLHGIENDIVREEYKDARAHFALNCASVGCPRLPREPFEGPVLDSQLERETRRFLAEPRNLAREEDAAVLSEIFSWYAVDFRPSPIEWIAKRRSDFELTRDTPVRYRSYDWALNRQ
ncbi:MAG: DUF547 domain-containing protein [Planctomycetota bacterium]